MKKLRLLLFRDCNRSCKGCCNEQQQFEDIQKFNGDFSDYETIIITGGEPMLKPKLIIDTCTSIRDQNINAEIILYTAKSKRPLDLIAMLNWVNNITLTLHEQYDVEAFKHLQFYIKTLSHKHSLRLNVFHNVNIEGINTEGWIVKDNIHWIKDCPLPESEEIRIL